MTRTTPQLALAWNDGVTGKRYGTRRAAYYAIAKRMVVAKYPPWLGDPNDTSRPNRGDEWTDSLMERRTNKVLVLFYSDSGDYPSAYFDERKWRAFVTRVARFLAFVDSRRTPAELIAMEFGDHFPSETLALIDAEYQKAEAALCKWAEYARDLRAFAAGVAGRR